MSLIFLKLQIRTGGNWKIGPGPAGISTSARRTIVRLSASCEPSYAPPETPQTSLYICISNTNNGALNWGPIMPRGMGLSKGRWWKLQCQLRAKWHATILVLSKSFISVHIKYYLSWNVIKYYLSSNVLLSTLQIVNGFK